ncbi:hypothetical protein NQZ68_037746 [Dissostichus eleginoides]|nr:hypothetical protein NQZ68_037746 [Dissostichus eleginoides]
MGLGLMMTPSLIQMMVMRLLLSATVHKHRLQEDRGQKREEEWKKRGGGGITPPGPAPRYCTKAYKQREAGFDCSIPECLELVLHNRPND